jgi:hypothetical protein
LNSRVSNKVTKFGRIIGYLSNKVTKFGPLNQIIAIVQIPLSLNTPPDCFMWGANKVGVFSVISAYMFLKKRSEVLNYNPSIIILKRAPYGLNYGRLKLYIPRHLQMMWSGGGLFITDYR